MSDPAVHPPLDARPEATTVTVRALVQRVLQGRVRVPDFQRPLRWRASDVRNLLDSVWRGYPIGSLLMWRRDVSSGVVRVGATAVRVPEVRDAWFVVDGQQRTLALTGALGLEATADPRWIGVFDPDTLEFRSGPPPSDRVGVEVPWSVLGDLRRLGQWMREHAVDPERAAILETAQQRLLDYTLPAYVVESASAEPLRVVFARLNSTGVQMRTDEVFDALLGGSGPRQLDLARLQADCDVEGFGAPERGDVMKAVLAIAGLDPTRRLAELADGDLGRLPTQEAATEALVRAVSFLREDAGIPHVRLLPYAVVLVILARWFAVHPDPSPATRVMLSRWLWRGVVTATHQRNEVSALRDQLRAIQPGSDQASLDRLLADIRRRPARGWDLRRFNGKNARSRAETLMMLTRDPRDREGPVSLRALVGSERVAREIFATSDLAGLPEDSRRLAQTAANRAVLDATHTGLQAELRRLADVPDVLASHLISQEAERALADKDVARFLTLRAEDVARETAAFLEARAGWDEPVLRTSDAYTDADDEPES